MELGIYTFAPLTEGGTAEQRLRELIEQIVLADQVGLDVFGVGEHHRPELAVSTPIVPLAAAAARTSRIRLTSAVTVLSSDDPIRVFQDFATLDLLSGGRAEIMVGRGSFIESFPLFGHDLRHYDVLFEEKLDLLLHARASTQVTWEGRHRAPLEQLGVYPRPLQDPLPVWVGVGGNPESAMRAGSLGLPMALGIIGGLPERFAPFAELHRESARRAGLAATPRLSINSHGYVADTPEQALETSLPYALAAMNQIGRERGWPPMGRAEYEAAAALRGANFVGNPEQVVEKILFQYGIFRHDRFLLQVDVGPVPHADVMRAIELFGTAVAPVVRAAVGRSAAENRMP